MVRSLKIRLQRLEEHTIKDITPIVWLTLLENGEYEVRVPEYRKGDKEVVTTFKSEKEAWDYYRDHSSGLYCLGYTTTIKERQHDHKRN